MLARLTGATSRAAGFVHGVAAISLLPYAGALAATPKAALAAVVLAAVGPGVARPKGVLALRGSEAGARHGVDSARGGKAADGPRTQVAWLTALASVVADPTTGFLAGLAAAAAVAALVGKNSKKAS